MKAALNIFKDIDPEQVEATGNHLLVELEKRGWSKGGIALPDDVKKQQTSRGVVLSVGPGRLREDGGRFPMEFKKGDVVLLNVYGGQIMEFGDEKEYKMIEEHMILAKVQPKR